MLVVVDVVVVVVVVVVNVVVLGVRKGKDEVWICLFLQHQNSICQDSV